MTTAKIQIKNRFTNDVLFECDAPEGLESGLHLRHALEQAVSVGANLGGANLRGANLRGANLGDANLRGAYLGDANLRGAYLGDANLRGANLRGANLGGANLGDANLGGANLRDANLGDANLRGANLRGAYLGDANLRGAYLGTFKVDIFDILLRAPKEIVAVRSALVEGRVNGSVYSGACSCLVGTIATARGVEYRELGSGIEPNSSRPAEQWFMQIKEGDTPENSSAVKLTVEWVDEFLELLAAAGTA
jgi:hypothetical protein